MSKKRTLLEKYDIPISHLDFGYINDCNNVKEMERIVSILRSGEEGYFPDLTKCAEERLKVLRPQSKILRTEDPVLTKNAVPASEWRELNEPMIDWIDKMRKKDRVLRNMPDAEKAMNSTVPPIRDGSMKIEPVVATSKVSKSSKPKIERIKAIEYGKWDKYDAETEELKIDLEEERIKEEVERMNRKNLENSAKKTLASIDGIDLTKLTTVEKEALALKLKDRGNDYFRAKEYKEAAWEYTQCLNLMPSANAYNNRAISYLKLMKYAECIQDCDSCIKIQPDNIKALLRKAKAYLELNKQIEAYQVYREVLAIDPNNSLANNAIKDLQCQLPPSSATRIQIVEEDNTVGSKATTTDKSKIDETKQIKAETQLAATQAISTLKRLPDTESDRLNSKGPSKTISSTKTVDYDLSKLIVPKKIIKSKLVTAAQALGTIQKQSQSKSKVENVEKTKIKAAISEIKISANQDDDQSNKKKGMLIQEI